MRELLAAVALLLILTGAAKAGDVTAIGVQAAMQPPQQVLTPSEDYWRRYPDVAADSYYGRSRPTGAREHYDCCGKFEGRTWNDQAGGNPIGILTYCGDHGSGGYNCLAFPQGGRLSSISWQSAVKAGNSEVLSYLMWDGIGIHKALMSAHHLGISTRSKILTLAEPVDITPGSTIWVYAEGWSDPHPGGFEAQITLYFLGSLINSVPQ